jgi:hypothetical protein
MARSSVIAGAVAAIVLAGGGVALVSLRPAAKPVAAATDPGLTTTTVRKTDLSDTRMVAGTLGFGSAHPVKGTRSRHEGHPGQGATPRCSGRSTRPGSPAGTCWRCGTT